MPSRSKKRALYLYEKGSWQAADASADDGSGFTAVHTHELSFADSGKEALATEYFTGRNSTTPALRGNDGGAITFATPVIGLSAGASGAPVADDWSDLLFNNAFGNSTDLSGDTIENTATTSTTVLDLDTGAFANQDLTAVYGAALNSGRVEIRSLGGSPDPYSLHRAFSGTPADSAIAYGSKNWRGPTDAGGPYLGAVLSFDGTEYMLDDGRVNSLGFEMSAGQLAKWNWGMQFDSRKLDDDAGQTAKSALPALSTFTGTPIVGQLGSVAWGSNEYEIGSVSIDFGLQVQAVQSVTGSNGRSGINVMASHPTITITPAYATSWDTDFIAGTTRNLEIKMGAGAVSGGVVNCWGFYAQAAEITAAPSGTDDNNVARQSVTFAARDAGILSGTTAYHYWQLARF